jgi:hypothetical protein
MIYYTYKIDYTDNNGHVSTVSQTRACEDVDYPTSLDDTKLIVQQQAWALNNFVLVTVYTDSTTIITQAEYNRIVSDPNGSEPIENWDPDVPLNDTP